MASAFTPAKSSGNIASRKRLGSLNNEFGTTIPITETAYEALSVKPV